MNLFTFDNISVKKEKTVIFRNVSFNVKEKKCFVIAGDNGTGKSTLLKLFNRLEKPEDGSIQYLNKNICDFSVLELRKDIAMVMQGPVLPNGSVNGFLNLVKQNLGIEFDNENTLKSVGLKNDILTKNTDSISGGETQLIALCVVLAKVPKVLLLDEITAALSPQMTEMVRNTIKELIDNGTSVIMVSHRKSEIGKLGNEGIILNNKTSHYFSDIEILLENLKVN